MICHLRRMTTVRPTLENTLHPPQIQQYAAGRLSLAELRATLARTGTPLVGPVDEGRCDVTFVVVDEEADEATTYHLRSLIDRALPPDPAFTPVVGPAVHVLTLRLPSALRFSYAIERQGPEGDRERIQDPWNHRTGLHDERLAQAVAVLPDARRLPALTRAAREAPTVHELHLASTELAEERRIWVSPPPGPTHGPLPVVIVFDGSRDHCAPAVRDALLTSGEIRPTLVVLVDQGEARDRDLPGSRPFSRFLAQELVPLLRQRFDAGEQPAQTILSGSSFGGLCAGWTALHLSDVFGGAIMQSPSCWYHPALARSGHGPADLLTAPTPMLIDAFERSPRVPVRIFQEVGELELGPPPAQVWQVLGNRWLQGVLAAKGYETTYREFAGGHDAAWWRGNWADAMAWMLPPLP